MSYSDLLNEEGVDSQFMAILNPKRKVTTWTNHAGLVYKSDFDFGVVSQVKVDGVAMTEGTSPTLSSSQFYYDQNTSILYLRNQYGDDPSLHFVVVNFEIYVATFDKSWYRNPLDDTTDTVYYDPLISKSPNLKATVSGDLFGFLPVQTSSIELINADHIFEGIIYDSSFNKAPIKIYHLLGDLELDNIKLIYNGLMQNVSYDQDTVSVKTFDRIDIFENEYRNDIDSDNFFSLDTFPLLDPASEGNCIRYVYGLVNGFIPVNISYNADAETLTTSDNRTWVVISGQTLLADLSRAVGGGTHTTTRTYVTTTTGFNIGDSVWMDRVSGTDEYVFITNVNRVSNYIEHGALDAPMDDDDHVKRSFVGNISIIQQDIVYQAMFGRDYTSNYTLDGTTSGFEFSVDLESNLTIPETLTPTDKVFCRVYGRADDLLIDGDPFGLDDEDTSNIAHPVLVIYDLLKRAGITEDEINLDDFQDAYDNIEEAIGLSIPDSNFSQDFPSYKEIILSIFQTTLLRMYLDNDNKWTISQIGPMVPATKDTSNDEIISNTFKYDFSYDDVYSDIVVEYDKREQDDNPKLNNSVSKINLSNDHAKYLHEVSKTKTFPSLHFKEEDAEVLAQRLSYIFGERSGTIKISEKNKFFDTLIADVIEINRQQLPGFEYDGETTYSANYKVTEVEKSLNNVNISFDDQKGIEDNSGGW